MLAGAALVLLAACAARDASPGMAVTRAMPPDPLARLRGHDAYGLVVSLAPPDVRPDMRWTERCLSRDEVCELLLSEAGAYQYASVRLSGTLSLDRIVIVKGLAQPGDIVRFALPRDRTLVPMSMEVAARAARRAGSNCDWVDGTPENRTGGVACKGWSYRSAEPARQ